MVTSCCDDGRRPGRIGLSALVTGCAFALCAATLSCGTDGAGTGGDSLADARQELAPGGSDQAAPPDGTTGSDTRIPADVSSDGPSNPPPDTAWDLAEDIPSDGPADAGQDMLTDAQVEPLDLPEDALSGDDIEADGAADLEAPDVLPEVDIEPPPPDPNVHAAPQGSGDACTVAQPCALTTARDRARELRQSGLPGVVVWLHGGRYPLSAPLELGPEDSGSPGDPARWEAWPDGDGDPVLSGGVAVTGWQLQDAGKGLWRAQVPAGLNTRQLFVNGVRAVRVRGMDGGAGLVETPAGYSGPAGMSGWRNPSDIEMVHLTYWKSFRCPIASIQGTTITMAQPCWSCAQFHQGFDMGVPSWVENAYELLDTPGEWYLDRTEDALYYIPRPGENLATAEVIVPVLERLVHVAGDAGKAHDIRLQGVGFEHTTWLRPGTPDGYPAVQAGHYLTQPAWSPVGRIPGAVVLEHVDDVEILDSRFERLGTSGIEMRLACHDVRVEGNRFQDLSGGAVYVGTVDLSALPDDASACVDTLVRNNSVEETGVEFHDTVGLFAGYTVRTTFEHNRLHRLPYSAMSVGWGWSTNPTLARENRVAANQVSFPMRRLADGGCIYTLSRQPDSEIQANWFHGQVHDYGAIYLDQGTMGYTVSDNVVASVPHWYLLQPVVPPQAQENVVTHNATDTASAYCCGPLGCCTQWNTVQETEVYAPGAWPDWARLVMGEAGLEPPYRSLPGPVLRIEAEDYDHGGEGVAFNDLTPGNAGGSHRYDDVDVYPAPFQSGGYVLGYTQTGEWLAYQVDVPFAGWYDLAFDLGTQSPDCAITLAVDGEYAGSLALPDTGNWSSFQTAVLPGGPIGWSSPSRVRSTWIPSPSPAPTRGAPPRGLRPARPSPQTSTATGRTTPWASTRTRSAGK